MMKKRDKMNNSALAQIGDGAASRKFATSTGPTAGTSSMFTKDNALGGA